MIRKILLLLEGGVLLAALLVGASRPAAVEFSFLVGIPTMLAAGGYKLVKEIKLNNQVLDETIPWDGELDDDPTPR